MSFLKNSDFNKRIMYAVFSSFLILPVAFAFNKEEDKLITWQYQTNQNGKRVADMALVLSQPAGEDESRVALTVAQTRGENSNYNMANLQPYKGAIDCNYFERDCIINVKFDNANIEEYRIFKFNNLFNIEPTSKFLNKLKKSETIIIEVPVSKNTLKQYEITTSNLKIFTEPLTEWHYAEHIDKMRNETNFSARVYSLFSNGANEYSVTDNKLVISLHKSVAGSKAGEFLPLIGFDNDYIVCVGSKTCSIKVKFDKNRTKEYKIEALSQKNDSVAINEEKIDFIKSLKKSSEVEITVRTIRGLETYKFDVSGLKWDF